MRDPGRDACAAPDAGHGLTSGAAAARFFVFAGEAGGQGLPAARGHDGETHRASAGAAGGKRARGPLQGGYWSHCQVPSQLDVRRDVVRARRASLAFSDASQLCSLRASLFGELTTREPTGTTQNEFAWATRVGQQR
jgi:hypothetical protein